MALISISTIIPFFLNSLGASTFQLAIAASMAMICTFVMQPFFGSIASRSHRLHKTFGKILLLQRSIFLVFVLSIPLFVNTPNLLVWVFLIFWGIFNLFVGSYNVFVTPLMLKLLPPGKRGTARGIGGAVGAGLGVIVSALIPIILGSMLFPYNYVLIFSLGLFFLFLNAIQFLLMREHEDSIPRVPMSMTEYIKEMPSSIKNNKKFSAMILTFSFLLVANSLLTYYTLYAIRVFGANESHIAALSGLAIITGAVGGISFGLLVDKFGPKTTSILAAVFVIMAGSIALTTNSLNFLFLAWIFANLANNGYMTSVNIMIGEVSAPGKTPLHVGVLTIISMALSSTILMVLAPVLENTGFTALFATVFSCGLISLMLNLLVLRRRLK